MAKTVAQVGRKGASGNQGGEEAQQDSVEVAKEDSAPPEEEEGPKTAQLLLFSVALSKELQLVRQLQILLSTINLKSTMMAMLECALVGVKQQRRTTSRTGIGCAPLIPNLLRDWLTLTTFASCPSWTLKTSSIAVFCSRRSGMITMLPS